MSARWLSAWAMLLACSNQAVAFELDCTGIDTLVAQASHQFTDLRGKQQSHITSGASAAPDLATRQRLLGEFSRERWQGTLTLAGASACEVVRTVVDDGKSQQVGVQYACQYPGHTVLPATLSRSLATCVGRPADPDADPTSLLIILDRVDSGEGHAITSVGADANPANGMRLLVSRSTCLIRRPGGCIGRDDE